MHKLTYEQRVQQMAEEMAPAFYTDYNSREKLYQELCIHWCTTHAKIAVAKQAEAIREYDKRLDDGSIKIGFWDKEGVYHEGKVLDYYLIENGYEPALECGAEGHDMQISSATGESCSKCGYINSPENEQK